MPVVKKVLVVCGTAIATASLIARTIEEGMAVRGIAVLTRQCKSSEVLGLADQGYDLVVSTTIISDTISIPFVRGTAFLSSTGHEKVMEEIAQILHKE